MSKIPKNSLKIRLIRKAMNQNQAPKIYKIQFQNYVSNLLLLLLLLLLLFFYLEMTKMWKRLQNLID